MVRPREVADFSLAVNAENATLKSWKESVLAESKPFELRVTADQDGHFARADASSLVDRGNNAIRHLAAKLVEAQNVLRRIAKDGHFTEAEIAERFLAHSQPQTAYARNSEASSRENYSRV